MMRVDLLRLMLPPARHGGASSVRCAWRTPQGAWQSETFESAGLIAARFEPGRVEVCPHPSDVAMTDIELPPLPVKRQRIAGLGVVELLALTALKNLTVGFGPRTDKGTVPVAWMSADVLSALEFCCRGCNGHDGQQRGRATTLRLDNDFRAGAFRAAPHAAALTGERQSSSQSSSCLWW